LIGRRFWSVCALALVVRLLPGVAFAQGEGYYEENTAPESADELQAPLEAEFEEEEVESRTKWLEDRLKQLPMFREDASVLLHLRSYYMRGKLKSNDRREAWTYGGWLKYDSGFIGERLSLGASYYFSQPIDAPDSRSGTRLLRPVQRPYRVFGESYVRVQLAERHELSLYRRAYDLPYLNKRDNRMSPNTFEGYAARGDFRELGGKARLTYLAGYFTRIKERNSERFVHLSERAGIDRKRGVATLGFNFYPTERMSIGAINHLSPDVINIFFTSLDRRFVLSDNTSLRLKLSYADQQSLGDDLLTGSSFHVRQESGSAALSYRGAIATLGFSTTSSQRGIQNSWGSPPNPTSMMLENFDRASEDAFLLGLSYNFRRLGLEGLSAFANYVRGNGARNNAGLRVPDQDELDLTVDWRVQKGPLRGLWVRVRGAFVNERDGGESQNELRVILNYELPLLQ
jgi:hypothetical protein